MVRVVRLGRSTCHAISGRGDKSTRIPEPVPQKNGVTPPCPPEIYFFIDNVLVRIQLIIEMIWWTGLAPWEFEFPFPGSLASTFLPPRRMCFAERAGKKINLFEVVCLENGSRQKQNLALTFLFVPNSLDSGIPHKSGFQTTFPQMTEPFLPERTADALS